MKKGLYASLIIFTVVSCLLLIAMGSREKLNARIITVGKVKLEVEIADNTETRRTGLMNRKSMAEDNGMLFIFDRDQKLSFWMKNTYIPLSIAYISSDGKIMEIYDMKPESLRPVESVNFVRYALEVNQGWFERNGIKPGEKVEF